jgi:hypothetical protein
MAIDLNDEIKLWGGFTATQFWAGATVTLLLFLTCAIYLSLCLHNFKIGFGFFFAFGGPWIMFLLYQRELPRGYLLRRWKQEGRFLFVHIKSVKGVDIYSSPANDRDGSWNFEFEDGNAETH